MKMCQRCLEEKNIEYFSKDKSKKDGLCSYCKNCKSLMDKKYRSDPNIKKKVNEASKKWRKENPERYKNNLKDWRSKNFNKKWSLDKKSHLWTHYRMTIEDYQNMLDKQSGVCFICKKYAKLYVDHDHNCCPGKTTCGDCIRGLLCPSCNTFVGFVEKNKEILNNIEKYIWGHKV